MGDLKALVDALVILNDDNLAQTVIDNNDVQRCLSELQDMLAADMEPVVRCKDCSNYIGGTSSRCGLDYAVIVDADDFCSRGVTE